MSIFNKANMKYRKVGNSGLEISVISIGNMINYKPQNAEVDEQIIKKCLQNGINHFDTAEMYNLGQAQTALGKYLKNIGVNREDIVISTKVWTGQDPDVNSSVNTNRKHVRESVVKSLKRLQMDYVDIIYAHVFDKNTNLEEICRAFNDVIENGQALYWGTSNWDVDHIFSAFTICQHLNLHKPIVAQNQYSMMTRLQIENQYEVLFTKYNYGLVAWSPLTGGFLTGKYLDGIKQNELNRFTDKYPFDPALLKKMFYDPFATKNVIQNMRSIKEIANQELGCSLTHLAIAWVIKFPYTSAALIGCRNLEQLEDNLKAIEVIDKLTPAIQEKINKIIGTNPPPRIDFKTFQPIAPLRPKVQ